MRDAVYSNSGVKQLLVRVGPRAYVGFCDRSTIMVVTLILSLASPHLLLRASGQFAPENRASLLAGLDSCFNEAGNSYDCTVFAGLTPGTGEGTGTNGLPDAWDVSRVRAMNSLFEGAHKHFNRDISAWDVSNVESMSNMFYRNTAFNKDISRWDVRKVTNFREMFRGAASFNSTL